ncbi:16562_t:CDS:2, partial [Acaulospora colombiana]
LTGVSGFDILDLLVASDEFLLEELIKHVQNYFIEHMTWLEQNLFTVLNTIFQLIFPSLNKDIFLELIKYDELKIEEVSVWEHLIKWGIHQTPGIKGMKSSDVKKFSEKNFKDLKNTMGPFIPYIRFYEISSNDFFNKVRPFRKAMPESLFEDVMSFLVAETEPKQEKLPARNGNVIDDSKIITRRHADIISNLIEKRDKVNKQGKAIAVIKVKGSGKIIGGFNANGWNHNPSSFKQFYGSMQIISYFPLVVEIIIETLESVDLTVLTVYMTKATL